MIKIEITEEEKRIFKDYLFFVTNNMFIRVFSQLSTYDAGIAGGKGASLGEMTQAGIPIPLGFVVLTSAFEHFLRETRLNTEIESLLRDVNPAVPNTIDQASERIQSLIVSASIPEDISREVLDEFCTLGAEYVAVRSSATVEDDAEHTWAGQLDSFLNVTRSTLLQNIQQCWASIFTPRALFYRFEKRIHDQSISVAVVIQQMVQSEVSGTAFSVHPVTENPDQLLIEAGYGLGEAVVSGQITPDAYVVEKSSVKITSKNSTLQKRGMYRRITLDSGEGRVEARSDRANE